MPSIRTGTPYPLLPALLAALLAAPVAAQEPAPTQPPVNPPAAPAGPAMTLQEAIDFAQQNNPRVGGAAAELRAAQARVGQRRAVRRPQLSNNGSVFRQGPVVPSFQPGGSPISPPYRWTVGVTLSQILLDFGQRSARQKSAEREANAAEHRLGETRNDVRYVATIAFYNVFRARELLTVAEERRAAAAEQLRVARARFESDVAPRFDVLRSEAELADAEQAVTEAQNDVSQSEAAFNAALGRDVSAPAALTLSRGPLPEQDVPFEKARGAALRARPQLAALRETVESGKQEVRARRAENKPQIGLTSSYDRRSATGFNPDYGYNAGLVMTFPFFDSGLSRARVREAQALVQADLRALEGIRQQVELEVRQSVLDLGEARRRIATAETEQRAAREALARTWRSPTRRRRSPGRGRMSRTRISTIRPPKRGWKTRPERPSRVSSPGSRLGMRHPSSVIRSGVASPSATNDE
jgi:outer membrane protein